MKAINVSTIVVLLVCVASFTWVNNDENAQIALLVFALGALGAIVREQLSPAPYKPIAAPLVGGISALMLMALLLVFNFDFALFPKFNIADDVFVSGKQALRAGVSLATVTDFYKVIVWSIASGLSERFTIDLYLRLTKKPALG